jgi:hypothetical protein
MISNVVNNAINHPFGNGLYNLFMVIWGMAYGMVLTTFLGFSTLRSSPSD